MCWRNQTLLYYYGDRVSSLPAQLDSKEGMWEAAEKIIEKRKLQAPVIVGRNRNGYPFTDFLLERTRFGWKRYIVVYETGDQHPFHSSENISDKVEEDLNYDRVNHSI
jgi:hypothetical protein